MGILLLRLLILLNDKDVDSTDYFIAKTLLMNYHSLSEMSINEVAKMCFVSKSTISKFIRTINFENYADFREAAIFKENRYGFSLNYNQNIMNFVEGNNFDTYFDIVKNDIDDLKKNIPIKEIQKLANLLNNYKNIAAFGLLFSEFAALDLQGKLAYNGKFISTNLDDVKQDVFIKNSKEDTLIILYSNSGLYFEKYQMADYLINKNFANTKAKIVLITSNKKIAKNPNVDLSICYNHLSEVQTHSVIYPLINDFIVAEYRKIKNKTPQNWGVFYLN